MEDDIYQQERERERETRRTGRGGPRLGGTLAYTGSTLAAVRGLCKVTRDARSTPERKRGAGERAKRHIVCSPRRRDPGLGKARWRGPPPGARPLRGVPSEGRPQPQHPGTAVTRPRDQTGWTGR